MYCKYVEIVKVIIKVGSILLSRTELESNMRNFLKFNQIKLAGQGE